MTDISKEEGVFELVNQVKLDSASSTGPIAVQSPDFVDNLENSIQKVNLQGIRGETVFKGKIVLNPRIFPINYYASLIHTLVTFFNLTTSTMLQPLILQDPDIFNIQSNKIGVLISQLILLQTLSKILLAPCYGFLVDTIGRKPMIFFGGILSIIGYTIVPFVTTVFPGYAFCKLLIANGANILALIPLNADYIHDISKGKATGITQALTSLGSFIGGIFITLMISMKVSLTKVHVINGIVVIGAILIYTIGIKGGRYFLSRDGQENRQTENRTNDSFILQMRKGMRALSKNGWLLITLVISTLARADYYLVTIMFALYIKSFDSTAEEKYQSNHLISTYQDLFFALGFLGNLFYGYILDKVNPMKVIFPALFIATFGYVIVLFVQSKNSPLIAILIITAGIAMPGLFNSSNYLGIKNFPRDLRGVLSSLLNVFGVVGYLFLSLVGGYFFDHHGRNAPFFLFAIMLIICTLLIVYIHRWMRLVSEKRRQRMRKAEHIPL